MPPRTDEFQLEIVKSDSESLREAHPSPPTPAEGAPRAVRLDGIIPFPLEEVRRERGSRSIGDPGRSGGDRVLAGRIFAPMEADLVELTRSLTAHLEVDTLLDAVVRGSMGLIECEGGFAAAVIDGELRSHRYVRGGHALSLDRVWEPGRGVAGRVLEKGVPFVTNHVRASKQADPELVSRFAVRTAAAVPIHDGRDRVAGVIVLHNRRSPSGFTAHDVEILTEVARSATVALRNALAFRALRGEHDEPAAAEHSRRLQTLGRFAGGIAHDFNNFLTVVLGQTDLLLNTRDGDNGRPELGEIREAALRARFLTRRLLSFSRTGSEEAEPLDAARHIREVARLLRRLVGGDIEIREELAENLPPVTMAPGQLDQILMNLVSNARDAMPEGGTIVLRSREAAGVPGGIVLEVEDTGTGMDDRTLRRIFDPYFTTKPSARGTGLGLATVAAIVRDAGGTIQARSTPGIGTAFSLFLPSMGPRESERAEENEPAGDLDDAPSTILLVEDEEAVRRLVRRVLRRRGYRVLEASCGAEAVERLEGRTRPVDLLLTDVMLPDMGGIQLWQLLSAKIEGQRTIFMSGYLEDDLPQVELERNEVEFLPKPFAIQDLLGLVENVLGST